MKTNRKLNALLVLTALSGILPEGSPLKKEVDKTLRGGKPKPRNRVLRGVKPIKLENMTNTWLMDRYRLLKEFGNFDPSDTPFIYQGKRYSGLTMGILDNVLRERGVVVEPTELETDKEEEEPNPITPLQSWVSTLTDEHLEDMDGNFHRRIRAIQPIPLTDAEHNMWAVVRVERDRRKAAQLPINEHMDENQHPRTPGLKHMGDDWLIKRYWELEESSQRLPLMSEQEEIFNIMKDRGKPIKLKNYDEENSTIHDSKELTFDEMLRCLKNSKKDPKLRQAQNDEWNKDPSLSFQAYLKAELSKQGLEYTSSTFGRSLGNVPVWRVSYRVDGVAHQARVVLPINYETHSKESCEYVLMAVYWRLKGTQHQPINSDKEEMEDDDNARRMPLVDLLDESESKFT